MYDPNLFCIGTDTLASLTRPVAEPVAPICNDEDHRKALQEIERRGDREDAASLSGVGHECAGRWVEAIRAEVTDGLVIKPMPDDAFEVHRTQCTPEIFELETTSSGAYGLTGRFITYTGKWAFK